MEASAKSSERKKIPEVVRFALNHVSRIEILILLHQGVETLAELVEITGKKKTTLSNHLREMSEAGAIEIAKVERKPNYTRYYYRPVALPEVSRAEAEAMTHEERHMISGFVLQSALAEALAALEAEKLADPRTVLYWNWENVDEQGRKDIEDAQEALLAREKEIAEESAGRLAVSGDRGISMMLTHFGYERVKPAPSRLSSYTK